MALLLRPLLQLLWVLLVFILFQLHPAQHKKAPDAPSNKLPLTARQYLVDQASKSAGSVDWTIRCLHKAAYTQLTGCCSILTNN
jgi:hypothetical protein